MFILFRVNCVVENVQMVCSAPFLRIFELLERILNDPSPSSEKAAAAGKSTILAADRISAGNRRPPKDLAE